MHALIYQTIYSAENYYCEHKYFLFLENLTGCATIEGHKRQMYNKQTAT